MGQKYTDTTTYNTAISSVQQIIYAHKHPYIGNAIRRHNERTPLPKKKNNLQSKQRSTRKDNATIEHSVHFVHIAATFAFFKIEIIRIVNVTWTKLWNKTNTDKKEKNKKEISTSIIFRSYKTELKTKTKTNQTLYFSFTYEPDHNWSFRIDRIVWSFHSYCKLTPHLMCILYIHSTNNKIY